MSNKKGGSKALTAVLAFILGFIFAIIVQIGAIVGVIMFVTSSKLDDVFDTFGLQNKDENDNYIYVNTDGENGGAETLGDLLEMLSGYLYSEGGKMDFPVANKTIDDIENLLPIVRNTIAEKLYPIVNGYIDGVDWDEFESIELMNLPSYLQGLLMEIRPAQLLRKLDMGSLVDGEDANAIVKALLAGAEFDYAYYGTAADGTGGLKFPVYFDTYTYKIRDQSDYQLDGYYRTSAVNGIDAFPDKLDEGLLFDTGVNDSNGDRIYNLYYVPVGESGLADAKLSGIPRPSKDASPEEIAKWTIYDNSTVFYAVRYDAETGRYLLDPSSEYEYYHDYGMHSCDRTGNFYFGNDGTEMQIFPVTLNSFSDPQEVFKPLYGVRITELMQGEIMEAMFGRHSVGELLDQKINIDECVDGLSLASVIDINPEEAMMAYIGYGLTNIKKTADQTDSSIYEATVDIDGVPTRCTVEAELRGDVGSDTSHYCITRVYYTVDDGAGGQKQVNVEGTKVKDVSARAMNMEMSALLEVKASDAILCYIGYGLYGVVPAAGDGYTHTGKLDVVNGDATETKTAYINTDESGKITEAWYDDAGKKVPIGGTTVNNVSGRISSLTEKLTLPDVLDIKGNENITVYIGYGVTGAVAAEGENNSTPYQYKGYYLPEGKDTKVEAYIATDENGKITSAWYDDGGKKAIIPGTPISGVSEKVQNISNELALADVLTIKASDNIVVYIGYGITGVIKEENADKGYAYTGTYKTADGETVKAYIATDSDEKVTSAWYMNGEEKVLIPGTVISGVSGRMQNISKELALADVLDIKATDKITAYIGYGITGLHAEKGEGYTYAGNYKKSDGSETQAYVSTNEDGKIISAWYMNGGEKVIISGTPIGDISQKVENISNDLTLADVMTISESDTVLWALRNSKISEVGANVKTLKLSDVLDKATLDGSTILKQLADTSINDLASATDNLSIQSIYADKIYQKDAINAENEADYAAEEYKEGVLYLEKDENGSYVYVNTKDSDAANDGLLTSEEFAAGKSAGKTYYTYGDAKGMWKLILMQREDNGTKHEKLYTLKNFHEMITSAASNVYGATLGELQEAEIIESGVNLDKTLTYTRYGEMETHSVVLKDTTLKSLIDIVTGMASSNQPAP